jgi:hypothetical protein
MFTEYYSSLSLGRDCAKQTLVSESRPSDYGSVEQVENDQRRKQVLLAVQEDLYQVTVAEEVEKIERDSQALNDIFKDLAHIINVSVPFTLLIFEVEMDCF